MIMPQQLTAQTKRQWKLRLYWVGPATITNIPRSVGSIVWVGLNIHLSREETLQLITSVID